jgi:hypothetical protein
MNAMVVSVLQCPLPRLTHSIKEKVAVYYSMRVGGGSYGRNYLNYCKELDRVRRTSEGNAIYVLALGK